MKSSIWSGILAVSALAFGGVGGCSSPPTVSLGDNGITGGSSGKASGSAGAAGGSNSTTGAAGAGAGNTTGAGAGAGVGAGTSGGAGAGAGGTSGTVCTNLQCDVVSCPNGGHTLVTGRIMDPAGRDPLYNVVAYIPNAAVDPLPSGVPPPSQGAMCATCDSLFSGEPVAVGFSDDNGNFVIQDAPATTAEVPLIVQVGKWRTHITLNGIASCGSTDAGSISLPTKMDPNDSVVNIPDIAVSTGSADSLECLLVRIGIDPSEYVPGNSTAGKVHIFNGGNPGGSGGHGGGGGAGRMEANLMSGAPDSDMSLWDSAADLSPYDLVLLSCEGGETYDAQPANLETYLNSGGRVFASHFHYAWFAGPLSSGQNYAAPMDWGTNLATWTAGSNGGGTANGTIVTTLWNGNPFIKGQALDAWLTNTSALGGSAPAGQLYIVAPKENASVSMSNTPSQPWIDDTATDSTLYFSFDTPIGGYTPPGSELGVAYCGRAVFSGLHVGGASYDGVNCSGGSFGGGGQGCNAGSVPAAPPPTGCDTSHPLSAQEKALEFMLFDLSSCVVPDTANPADAGVGPINFK